MLYKCKNTVCVDELANVTVYNGYYLNANAINHDSYGFGLDGMVVHIYDEQMRKISWSIYRKSLLELNFELEELQGKELDKFKKVLIKETLKR